MLKIGLAGCWHVHFDGYAKTAAQREDCKIVALWDPDEKKGKEKADKFGCEYVADYDEFLKKDIDAVMVCAATNIHPEVLLKAANAKKHIFTEKVLTAKTEDAERVSAAVKENGVNFCISFIWRARADFLWIKDAVDSGLLGQLTYVRMRNAHNGVSANWLPDSFLDRVPTCGGAMMDLGAHGMYILNWLLGEPESVTSVFTNVMCNTVEDNCVSVLKYKNGAIGVNETAFVAQSNPFSLEVVGTKGTIMCGGADNKLCYKTDGDWVYPDIEGLGKVSPLESFLDVCLNGGEIPYTIDDAVALTKTMAAAYENIN